MYVIIVYDISGRRVAKVCKYLRTTLQWVQNSVFEGNLTEAKFEEVKDKLHTIINKDYDSILMFAFSAEKWVDRQIIGIEKHEITNLL